MRSIVDGLAIIAALLATSHAAVAEAVFAGPPGSAYLDGFCPKVVESLRLDNFRHRCTASRGTVDNLAKVIARPSDVGIGQLDVIANYVANHLGQLAVVDASIGAECLFAVTSDPDSPRFDQLPSDQPLALPPADSGAAATFRLLQSFEPDLAQLRKIDHYESATAAVAAVRAGKDRLAFFVAVADPTGPEFKSANAAGLHFLPVLDRAMLSYEPAHIPVYEPRAVGVAPARSGHRKTTRVATACTPVVLFTGHPLRFPYDSGQRDDQQALIKALSSTDRPDSSAWRSIFNNMHNVSRQQLEALF